MLKTYCLTDKKQSMIVIGMFLSSCSVHSLACSRCLGTPLFTTHPRIRIVDCIRGEHQSQLIHKQVSWRISLSLSLFPSLSHSHSFSHLSLRLKLMICPCVCSRNVVFRGRTLCYRTLKGECAPHCPPIPTIVQAASQPVPRISGSGGGIIPCKAHQNAL